MEREGGVGRGVVRGVAMVVEEEEEGVARERVEEEGWP